jgi:glycosyltransferase involved in cell wall biosynthesis
MKNNPKVSVLLPVCNTERYVGETIRSIINQSFSDFELIIINDGSSDESLKIVQSFDDKKIIVINQENQGLPTALNNAANFASGEYLARIDADDICRKDRFQKQVDYLD